MQAYQLLSALFQRFLHLCINQMRHRFFIFDQQDERIKTEHLLQHDLEVRIFLNSLVYHTALRHVEFTVNRCEIERHVDHEGVAGGWENRLHYNSAEEAVSPVHLVSEEGVVAVLTAARVVCPLGVGGFEEEASLLLEA